MTAQIAIRLAPCPFCGEMPDAFLKGTGRPYICCHECDVEMRCGHDDSAIDVVKRWNRRANGGGHE